MREIKFRAWDKDSAVMVSSEQLQAQAWNIYGSMRSPEHSSWVYMQYTGLKEKNGKEIYEGDQFLVIDDVIVETIGGYPRAEPEGITRVVVFEQGAFYWGNDLLDEWAGYGEVVGNIYENPELLTNTN